MRSARASYLASDMGRHLRRETTVLEADDKGKRKADTALLEENDSEEDNYFGDDVRMLGYGSGMVVAGDGVAGPSGGNQKNVQALDHYA